MRMPQGLRRLDDRVLGDRGKGGSATTATRDGHPSDGHHDDVHDDARPDDRPDDRPDARPDERTTRTTRTTRTGDGAEPRTGGGDGLASFLAVVWRVARLVLLALGLLLLVAVAFLLLPANEDNVIVSNVLSLADRVAGPFRDVFTVEDPDRMRIFNYALAAAVYFVVGSVVGKLPTGSKRKS
jgi:hypothetical protein